MHFILDHRVERNIGRVKEQVSCPPSLHSGGEWEEKCVTRRQGLGPAARSGVWGGWRHLELCLLGQAEQRWAQSHEGT